MPQVQNPILPGFNPDPSILRVGDDYYIATSTFEWYPGVQIHHSKDLANWELITRPLTRKSQLDMRGDPDSCGIFAPCLTHDGEKFWLVYTDVKRLDGSFKDCLNYVVHASSIKGPWSDPVFANSSGFDPSLFHDENGTKWYVNMILVHYAPYFAGIMLQEFSPVEGKLVGPRKNIFKGTDLGCVEGPHLYQRNGWYYLLCAEGGTSYGHACVMARSRNIWGPYETHPQKYIITSKDSPSAALQCAGHGDIVETVEGKVYVVHLASRPITEKRRSILGRETSIQEAYWGEDDWLYIKNGPVPSLYTEVMGVPDTTTYWAEKRYTFSAEAGLHQDFQWLRTPEPERIFSLEDDGVLTLYGCESIGSWFEQALVARRQTHFSYDAETVISISPEDERHFAGLTAYYGRYNFFYLAVSATPEGQRHLSLLTSERSYPEGTLKSPLFEPIPLPGQGKVKLALSIRLNQLQFYYAMDGEKLESVGPVYDASILSDECGGGPHQTTFTGAFVGVAASDLNGLATPAKFDYFIYRPVKHETDRYDV
ncbi:glycoside hydrolase family 43 protein [Cadophora sp. DSE1049]|nr:glycoside hydrolase family 43 protein [Cadophora sp. DSE1049]